VVPHTCNPIYIGGGKVGIRPAQAKVSETLSKKMSQGLGMVSHTCNPSN
jgi:hypothetical protein